ncbi:MFS family permease [Kitasatospora sp. MAP12-15]|uniref:DUF4153 domain-containing protein n=1 Tax=unclassified Kitasatospora TaxID=2633591 RepID=UPI002475B65B|nr:DUF4173 domain-containing protein [Kitasatospora sp. MAP12-44]MDH6108126.1 MFS family permease [Kitasatospora sp. MAP12-44]
MSDSSAPLPTGDGPWAWDRPAWPVGPPKASRRADWLKAVEPGTLRAPTLGMLVAAAVCGVLATVVLGDGVGVNLLLCALVCAVGGGLAARARAGGRRPRAWTVTWALASLVLLVVPVVSAAGGPVLLAVLLAVTAGALALQGGRRWAGVLLAPLGLAAGLLQAPSWALKAVRGRSYPGRDRVLPVLRASLVALVLVAVFGALFAGADEAVGQLLGDLTPSVDLGQVPLRVALLVLGLAVALSVARTGSAPFRWDRLPVGPGRERGRLEWAVPVVALNLLFAIFAGVQVFVFFVGYQGLVRHTGVSPSVYARQGFWQLLWVTLLALVVVALARRWAPRTTAAERLMVKVLLSTFSGLTLVVVCSAIRRMQFYVDASGLTRLRLCVLGVEAWLGVVFLVVLVAGLTRSAEWLPRAVMLSAVVAVAGYGLVRPDAVVAEQNVARFEQTGQLDLRNVRGLSADAVPALDRLPSGTRSCALELIGRDLAASPAPWYAISVAEDRARDILRARPPQDGEPMSC